MSQKRMTAMYRRLVAWQFSPVSRRRAKRWAARRRRRVGRALLDRARKAGVL